MPHSTFISKETASGCWRVRCYLFPSERRFYWKQYGSKDNAYKAAEKWRDAQLEQVVKDLDPINIPSPHLPVEQEEEKISNEQQRKANMIMNLVNIFVPPDENTERYQQEAKDVNNKGREGYIYCLYNPGHPLVYKIGFTRRTVEDRLNELNKVTSLCFNFVPIISKKVTDCVASECRIHKELAPYRLKKEFFQAPLDKIQNLFDSEG